MEVTFIIGLILLTIFNVLAVYDFVSTYLGVEKYGAIEDNPVVATILKYSGWLGFAVVKIVYSAAVVCIFLTTVPKVYLTLLVVLVIIYSYVAWNNYHVLKQQKEDM